MRAFLALLAAGLSACSLSRSYIPAAQPVPLFSRPGDFHAEGAFQQERGVQAQAAAAVAPRVAVLAAGTYGQLDNCFSCSKRLARHLEIGLGTYGEAGGWTHTGFLGGGWGRFGLTNSRGWDPDGDDLIIVYGRYRLAFAQWEAGRIGRVADRVFSTRFSLYEFDGMRRWNGFKTPLAGPAHWWGAYLEPALTLRLGYRWIKAEGQAGLSLPLYQAKGFDNQKVWFSLGFAIEGPG